MLKVVKLPAEVMDITESALYLEEHVDLRSAVRFLDLCDEAFKRLA